MLLAYEQRFIAENIDPMTQQSLLQDIYQRLLQEKYSHHQEAKNLLHHESIPEESSHEGSRQSLVKDSLQGLDQVQEQTMAELDYYNQQQAALQDKLKQQEELLALVQRDIDARENLIEDVFTERVGQQFKSDAQLPQPAKTPEYFASEGQAAETREANNESSGQQKISDLISNQLAGVDSYLELKR